MKLTAFKRLATGKHGTGDIHHVNFNQVVHQMWFGLFHKNKEDFLAKGIHFNPLDKQTIAYHDVITRQRFSSL